MAIDPNLPMMGQPVDTTQAIPQMQQQQMAQLQIIKQQYDNATEQEKADAREEMKDVFKIEAIGGDAKALDAFINNPKNLNTQAAMEMRDEYMQDQTPDKSQFLNGVKARKNLAVALGFVEDPTTSQIGGDTGALVDRLISEGSAKNVNDALMQIKGGAGQMGKNLANIDTGGEAERVVKTGGSFGTKQGEAVYDLPRIRATGAEAITAIDNALASPGLKNITGWASLVPILPGGERKRAEALLDQVQGRQFLAAYEMLKGGGQITEIEGTKGEAAIAALGRAQDSADVTRALKDLRGVVVRSIQAKEQAATQTPEQIKQDTFKVKANPPALPSGQPETNQQGSIRPALDALSDEQLLQLLQ